MAWAAVAVGVVSIAATAYSNKKNRDAAERAADRANSAQAREAAKLEKQKEEYKAMVFKNPYEDMENPYEDLTVNQQQARFQAQQGSQQRANIMYDLSGAAGSSGIAALAQSLANQGQLQTQVISASIGKQEAMNQRLRAQGAGTADLQQRKGEELVQGLQSDRQATLLGMQMGQTAGANASARAAELNQQQVDAAANAAMAGAISSAAVGIGTAGASNIAARKTQTTVADPYGGSGPQARMATPTGVSASGEPLVTQVVTPTGGEVLPSGGSGDYTGGFGKKIIGYDENMQPIYG
tara:strand:- start:1990 stop:2877 length:888 start_codon:yes stop_codon:yes gene_type:complete